MRGPPTRVSPFSAAALAARDRAWAPLAVLIALAVAAAGCGGASGESGALVGRSHARRPAERVELLLTTTEGETVEVADQRGSPVLLVLFATYDGASIASQRPLAAFTREHLETVVIAVATQPDAEVFAREYARVIDPPYTVAYEEDDTLVEGTSSLGVVEAIPAFVMIDAEGRERGRHMGYASRRTLEELWARATGGVPRETGGEAFDEGETPESAAEPAEEGAGTSDPGASSPEAPAPGEPEDGEDAPDVAP